MAVMLVLGLGLGIQVLGLGLESGPWPWPWPKAKDHFQDSVGQMLSCCTPVSTTAHVHNSTTTMTVTLLIYFMYPDGICAPWILV